MTRFNKPSPGATDAQCKNDIDQAFKKAKELGLLRQGASEARIESVLSAVLRGQALHPTKGIPFPDDQQFHPWMSHEDAAYVLNVAKRNGWLTMNALPEGKIMKVNTYQLRSLIKEAIQSRQPGSPLWEAPQETWNPEIEDLIQQLAMAVAEEVAGPQDPGDVLPEVQLALNAALENIRNDFGDSTW